MSFGELGRRGPPISGGGAEPPPPSRARSEWGGSNGQRLEEARSRPGQGDVGQTTSQISDWLRQLQHNLALLERLGDSLEADGSRPSDQALRQVSTQQDVVEELSATVRRGLGELSRQIDELPRAEQGRPRAAHSKLKKDSDRLALDLNRVLTNLKQSRRNALAKKSAQRYASGGPGSYSSASATPDDSHRVGRAQFGRSDAPGDLDVMIGDERVQLQVAMQEEAINDAILQEREEEIREINQNVHKVNEIFKDLANLVDKQQHEVDQISELVEKSHQHAEKGLDQVQKAAKLQPSCAIS